MTNLSFIDIINILSFLVGIENLNLNNQQIDHLEEHLENQDDLLLKKIIEQNEEIINLLKGKK